MPSLLKALRALFRLFRRRPRPAVVRRPVDEFEELIWDPRDFT